MASTIILTGYNLFIFLAYGTTASVARLLGANDERSAAGQAVQAIWLAAGIGTVLFAVGQVFADAAVSAIGASDEVAPHALVYLRISLFGAPALLVTLAGTGYLRGLQDTRTPMAVAIGTNVINLVLEVVLIYGFDQGIGASALATVIAQVCGVAVYLRITARAVRRHHVALRPDARAIKLMGRVSFDLFVRTIALRIALVIATSAAARMGTNDIAAHQVAFEIWSFLALVLDAIAIAAQALIGRHLGAGEGDRAKVVGRRMLAWGWWAGTAFGAAVFVLRSPIASIFSDDPAVTGLAAFVLIHVAVLQPVNGLVFVLDGILIGASDMRFLAIAMPISTAAFAIAGGAVIALGAGLGWLWASLGIFMAVRLATLLYRFAGDRWLVVGAVRA